jgi:hypothetical protein
MESKVNRASATASGMQQNTCAGCLGTGQSAEYERQSPMVIGGASSTIPRMATTRSSCGSTQQQVTQPVETGKPRQRIQWSEEMNTFIMRQYYTITKLETLKIGYTWKLHDRFTRQYPEMEISEQQIADQWRAIVTKALLSKPWLEEIRAQVAEIFKETNVNTEEEIIQSTDKKKESWSLESPQTVENLELDKIKI